MPLQSRRSRSHDACCRARRPAGPSSRAIAWATRNVLVDRSSDARSSPINIGRPAGFAAERHDECLPCRQRRGVGLDGGFLPLHCAQVDRNASRSTESQRKLRGNPHFACTGPGYSCLAFGRPTPPPRRSDLRHSWAPTQAIGRERRQVRAQLITRAAGPGPDCQCRRETRRRSWRALCAPPRHRHVRAPHAPNSAGSGPEIYHLRLFSHLRQYGHCHCRAPN